MEETKSDTSHLATLDASPTGCNRRDVKLNILSNPRACTEAELRIFPSPRAYLHICRCKDDRNFSKSQSPGGSSGVEFSQGPYKGGEFEIFPSPRDYMKAVLGSPKAHIDTGVPNPIY